MTSSEFPESILVIGAHPDDCEFGAGGVAYEWGQKGCRVHFLIVTDGSKGSAGCGERPQDLVRVRRREQTEAARVLGVTDCHFLGFPDGEVDNDRTLLRKLVEVIRELRPAAVFTHTPEHLDHRPFRGGDLSVNHRDHRAVGAAALDAVYPFARNPNAFADLNRECHRVGQVFLWGSRFCNVEFSVPDGLNQKALALACHKSQFPLDTDWEILRKTWGETETFERINIT